MKPRRTGNEKSSMSNRRLRATSGVTLIEILISVVIFAIVLLGLIGFMDVIQENNQYNRQFSSASFLGQAKIEELMSRNYTAVALNNTSPSWIPDPAETITATGLVRPPPQGEFRRQWKISLNSPTPGLKKIEVRVDWLDRKQKNHRVDFESAKAAP